MTPEGKLKKYACDQAKKHGLKYINLIVTGDDGNPDKIFLPHGGKCVFAEFKRPDGRGDLSDAQKEKIREYRKLGYDVWIIFRKEDVDDLIWEYSA